MEGHNQNLTSLLAGHQAYNNVEPMEKLLSFNEVGKAEMPVENQNLNHILNQNQLENQNQTPNHASNLSESENLNHNQTDNINGLKATVERCLDNRFEKPQQPPQQPFDTSLIQSFSSLNRYINTAENSMENMDDSTNMQSLEPSTNELAPQKRKISMNSDDNSKVRKTLNTVTEEKKPHRKNIRDVMNEDQLDTNTIAAQREESERLARVAGQQKSMRDIQKQIAVCKHFVREQSLLFPDKSSDAEDCDLIDIIEKQQSSTDKSAVLIEGDTIEIKAKTNEQSSDSSNRVTKEVSGEVVTIEDSSSDDDCILLSEDEEEEEEFNETEDAHNSGIHVKDAYNIPDEFGRVVVNIGHPEGEDTIYLAPQVAKIIKPHQIGGVRFLYDNVIESTKRFKKSTGFGCILAHSMGLGKTLQVISFCDIFLRHTPAKSVLCVMPINTLQNWQSEFNMWIPRVSLNEEVVRPRNFDIFVLNDQQKTLTARAKVILNWAREGGVLLIGYELFRLLALKITPNRKKKNQKLYSDGSHSSNDMIDNIQQALVKPGPDLVICDEGHRIKNSHAGISQALKMIRTRRRIVLTGYPLQNNLLEYWCMVDFVRPNYLGSRTEFCNMFERPIQNGQCVDSTPDDIKLMRYRAHVLHSLLVGFVQRRSHEVLQKTLPGKLEYVILVRMTPFQRKLYDTFMTEVVRKKTFPNPLKAFAVCCKIWNHPDVLYNFIKKSETDLDLEIDEELAKNTPPGAAEQKIDNATATVSKTDVFVDEANISTTNSIKNEESAQNSNETPVNFSTVATTATTTPTNAAEVKGDESKKRSGMNFFAEDENVNNFGPTYPTDNKPNNFWLDTTIPSKPNHIGMMVKQTGVNLTKDLENLTGSSDIVDLDTKEIKTIETNIPTKTFEKGAFDAMQKDQIPGSSMGNSTLNQKKFTDAALDITKKIQKPKNRYDEFSCSWAIDLMKNYEPGQISSSPKMEIFFCILSESIFMGDRILLFSQSLLTLNLIEGFLKATYVPGETVCWKRNISYFRLDGSTSSQERERLVNEFNSNPALKLFLISTRAGSLGINLTGANRVIIFDASWNPCHDTQAVYRVYRYGQRKSCYIYRLVMDKCLEKKIYDRQIKKQGMSDRVVDECNPEAHLSMKDVTNLCHDYDSDEDCVLESTTNESAESPETLKKTETTNDTENPAGKSSEDTESTWSQKDEPDPPQNTYADSIINKVIEVHKNGITKNPFFHESLLVDRKDRKLSQAEKRQAHRSYEMEKKASVNQKFNYTTNKIQYKIVRNDGTVITRPVASIRPMQAKKTPNFSTGSRSTRWIPAEVWQRQGMTAQEMTLPLDVVIPTNSAEKTNIILKAGQRVMVLKSSKGIYMQLDSGKIIAIRTTNKTPDKDNESKSDVIDITSDCDSDAPKKPGELIEDTTTSSDKTDDSHEKKVEIKNEIVPKPENNANANPKAKPKEQVHQIQTQVRAQTQAHVQEKSKTETLHHQQQQSQPQQPQQQQQQPQQQQQQQQQQQKLQETGNQRDQTTHNQHYRHFPQQSQAQSQSQSQTQTQAQAQPQAHAHALVHPHPPPPHAHTTPQQQQQQQQQLYKHQYLSQYNPQHQPYNNHQYNMPSSIPETMSAESGLAQNTYFQNREMHPYQFYDYYDNSNKSPTCSYQLNDYATYGHINYSPYHSHLPPSAAAYGGAHSTYLSSNAFQRPHWNPTMNSPANNEAFRPQSSTFIGTGCQQKDWSS